MTGRVEVRVVMLMLMLESVLEMRRLGMSLVMLMVGMPLGMLLMGEMLLMRLTAVKMEVLTPLRRERMRREVSLLMELLRLKMVMKPLMRLQKVREKKAK